METKFREFALVIFIFAVIILTIHMINIKHHLQSSPRWNFPTDAGYNLDGGTNKT